MYISHNKACFNVLEATGTTIIVEISSVYSLWGASLGMKDRNLENFQLLEGSKLDGGNILEKVEKNLLVEANYLMFIVIMMCDLLILWSDCQGMVFASQSLELGSFTLF